MALTQSHPRGPPPTSTQIFQVGAVTIATLKSIGVKGCFVGGVACQLFGNIRQPNDVDILCLDWDSGQEALKCRLVSQNSSFYLVASRDPCATYKVLWYRLEDTTNSCVKVDLLFPGTLNIPSIPSSTITSANAYSLPSAPFSLVLLLKLQAWIHHGDSPKTWYRVKQPTDARDIKALLPLAVKQGVRPRSDGFLPQTFIADAAKHVARFVAVYPNTREAWDTLGFKLIEAAKNPLLHPKRLALFKHSVQLELRRTSWFESMAAYHDNLYSRSLS